MLQSVDVGGRSLEAYRSIAPAAILEELRRCAVDLRGARVLHLNATPYGGGVSELLRSAIPLLNDLGLVADWKIISGDEAFFQVTKAVHNGLQGADRVLTAEEQATYLTASRQNAQSLEESYDFIVVHDPQPAAILPLHGKGTARWIWRCHIDTAQPNPAVWGFLRGYLTDYDAAVFTMDEFIPPSLPIGRVAVIPPAIDPLSPKNLPLPDSLARQILAWSGIDLNRPLITQVSRFDPWKDPFGVIAAYRLVREQAPHVQLALVGSMALDDPEGWAIYRDLQTVSAADPLIHIFTNLTGISNIEVNTVQRLSDVVVQKSIREGFGLVVSEALWKGTPVVAGRAGGIPLQMADGVGGLLVESVEACADAILQLLHERDRAAKLATDGQARVRQHFLLPRLLLNELELLVDLARAVPVPRAPADRAGRRDPVCGMALPAGDTVLTASRGDQMYAFCSETCRRRFLAAPDRYLAVWQRQPVPSGL
jgi:trehalose synthase